MIRALLLGVTLLAFSVAAVGCDDDADSNGEPIATPTQVAEPTEPPDGSPTAPLSSELPQDVIDAVEAYVVAGSIPSFPAVESIAPKAECTAAGQVCYDADASSFDEGEATVRVYSYASDDIQDVSLELADGSWTVTGYDDATR